MRARLSAEGGWTSRHLLFAVLVLTTCGCRRPPPTPPTPPTPIVSVLQPVEYLVQEHLEYNGYLEAVESVQIRARVQGFLQEIHFVEGQEVKKGDLLFKIDPRETAAMLKRAEADKAKAVAELTNARSEEARAKRLVQNRNLSEEEYQTRLSAKESAEATVKQTEAAVEAAQIQVGYTTIHAPIDGRISRTLVTRGNIVGINEPTLLTTIVSPHPLFVYFDIPERDLVTFIHEQRNQRMNLRESAVKVGVATEDGFPHTGKIDFQDNRVESETGTVRIRGRIPNPPLPSSNLRALYPGLFARVQLPIGSPQPRFVIPEEALLTGQEGRFVYVIGKDNLIEKRTVTPGPIVWRKPSNGSDDPQWSLEGPPKDPRPEPKAPIADAPGSSGKKVGPTLKTELPPPTLRSLISIQKGLSGGDRIVFNGIQRARPGSPVVPETWKLNKPAGKPPLVDAQAVPIGGKSK
jgi:membrane fusion protein, multidrug efflux system